MNYKIVERTFDADKYPKDSKERAKLNEDIVTSEYGRNTKYIVFTPSSAFSFKTRKEAEALVHSAK